MNPEDYYYEQLANHFLEEVLVTDKVKCYYLKEAPGSRMMSTLITFTPEGIVLQGDLTPERNGSVSVFGYGISWFSGDLSSTYLAEKFLEKTWVREIAADVLAEWSKETDRFDAEQIEGLEEIIEYLRYGDMGPEEVYRSLDALQINCDDGIPGMGYEPSTLGWLCAIQRRFAECYQQKLKENEKVG